MFYSILSSSLLGPSRGDPESGERGELSPDDPMLLLIYYTILRYTVIYIL